ncbi:uncharacterized protein [Antedon mediterranea]|uniref:uncharacterized protein isoform X2 n=1 Tax=Antedon mediterranea TaxID=105859 RepID=UPI003AF9522E
MNVYIIAALHLLLLFIVNGAPVNEYTQTYEKYKTNITNSLECSATADDDRVQKLFEEDKLEPSSPSLFLACATPDSDQQTTVCKAILDKLSKICNNAKAKTILDYNVFAVLHTRLDKSMASENEDRIREAVKMITDIGSLDEQICEPSTPLRVACLLLWQIKEAEETTRTTSATKFPTDKAENEKVDQNRHDSNNNDEPPLLKENEHPDPDLPNKVGTSTTNTGSTFGEKSPPENTFDISVLATSALCSNKAMLSFYQDVDPQHPSPFTVACKHPKNVDESKVCTSAINVLHEYCVNKKYENISLGWISIDMTPGEREEYLCPHAFLKIPDAMPSCDVCNPNHPSLRRVCYMLWYLNFYMKESDKPITPNSKEVSGETTLNNGDEPKQVGGETSENKEDEGKEPTVGNKTSENNEAKEPNAGGENNEDEKEETNVGGENKEDEGKEPNDGGKTSESDEDERKKPNVDGETSENNEDKGKKPNGGESSENNEDEGKEPNIDGETSENNEDERKKPNVDGETSENNEDEGKKPNVDGETSENNEDEWKKPNVDGETSENNEDERKKPNVDGKTSENNEDELKKQNVGGETSENNEDEGKEPNVSDGASENNEDENNKSDIGGGNKEDEEDQSKDNSSEDDYDSVPAPDSSFEDNEKNVQKYKPNIGGDFGKDDYYLKENQKTYDSFKNRKFEEEESSSHFLAYSLTAIILILATYIAYHNKRKIIAVIIEGRGKNGKRGGSYRRLNQNVSDAMPTLKA